MQPKIFSSSEHTLNPHLIDKDALYIILRLKAAGFTAYLVGGGVRDLLLGNQPKDFDISTSARPEQIKKVFGRQCILIGRRFRLAHIRFGHKVIEVSTFRSGETSDDLITHDNVFGTEQEDVLRRDFTINGLYYDPETNSLIDYVGGREDLQIHVLHTIGDPETRFKQDPVRMLRLLKFQARFGFKASPEVSDALVKCMPEIVKSSPARVLEELFRMLESCASNEFFKLLNQSEMLHWLFPELHAVFQSSLGHEIYALLAAIDQVNKKSPRFPIERSVLIAALLFPILDKNIENYMNETKKIPHLGDVLHFSNQVIKTNLINSFSHFPKRISSLTTYVLSTQYRLIAPKSKRIHPIRIFRTREFPLALRLLKLRAIIHPHLQQPYIFWRENYRQYLRKGDSRSNSHKPIEIVNEQTLRFGM